MNDSEQSLTFWNFLKWYMVQYGAYSFSVISFLIILGAIVASYVYVIDPMFERFTAQADIIEKQAFLIEKQIDAQERKDERDLRTAQYLESTAKVLERIVERQLGNAR